MILGDSPEPHNHTLVSDTLNEPFMSSSGETRKRDFCSFESAT